MLFSFTEVKSSFLVAVEDFQRMWANWFHVTLLLLQVLFSVMLGEVKEFESPCEMLGLDNK